jgi:hypothetical protein
MYTSDVNTNTGDLYVSKIADETPEIYQCWSKHVVYMHQWRKRDFKVQNF